MNIGKFSLLILGCLIYSNWQSVEGARILAVFVFPAKSHFMITKALVKELTERGHEVTLLTSLPIEEKLQNYTEILIDPAYDFWDDIQKLFNAKTLFELTKLTSFDFLKMLETLGLKTTEHALKHHKVQQIINQTNDDTHNKYDLLIAEQFFQEAFLTFSLQYQIPVITVCTFGYANYMSQMMGVISPLSHVPHGFMPYDDRMDFTERTINTLISLYDDYFREIIYFPQQDALVRKYFSHLPIDLKKVTIMEKNISLMLLNSYVPLINPRPEVPGMIAIGGVHIMPTKQLPNDIQKFLDEADNGAIYFNLGTNIRSADMPPEKLTLFLEMFGKLKERVLWKWEDENIPKLPNNVMVKKWMPQNDILAHSNVKLFITHGGLLGTQEGVYHATPMLGIPVYCDQYLNMRKASKSGYAITVDYTTLNKIELETAVHELLHNPIYMKNVQRYSKIFRDRPMTAMETSMYWIEYVIRHNGALHIRSAGADLPWYKFYLIDVIGVILFIVLVSFMILFLMCRKVFRFCNQSEINIKKSQ